MNWLKRCQLDIINVKYLYDIGMSRNNINGELVQLQDSINNAYIDIVPGTIAVLLDAGQQYIIAISSGFGFIPFRTEPKLWKRTGSRFVGSSDDLKRINDEATGKIDLTRLSEVIDVLKNNSNLTDIFITPNRIRAVFYEKPLGPQGYRSRFQILLNAEQSGMISLITIVNGETRTLKIDQENVVQALEAAMQFIGLSYAS